MSSSVSEEEEIDLPNWSDTSDDDDPDDYMILDPYADFLLSVETAKLKIGGGDRRRRIYGDIHISGCQYGKAFTLYHRTAYETETVSLSPLGADLTLCGPRYSVYGRAPELLYVDLHEYIEGEDEEGVESEEPVESGAVSPLLQKIVPLHSHCRNLEANKPFQVSAEVGDRILTVNMTAFSPSVVTRIELTFQGCHASSRFVASGTVSAVQTSVGEDGELKRTVPLYRRPGFQPLILGPPITYPFTLTLDRQVVVTPVHIDDYLTQKKFELTLLDLEEGVEPLYKPTDPVHGVGSSLVIDVDLLLLVTEGFDRGRSINLRGAPKFELMGSDRVGGTYHAYIVGHSKKIRIKVSVTSFLNYSCGDLDDEVFEEKLPLYKPVDDGDGDGDDNSDCGDGDDDNDDDDQC